MNANCKTWIIPRAEETPDWNAVPELEVSEVLWLPDCGIRAFGRFCYNAESLHVRLRAVEENIRAEYTAPLSRVCEDSCLEFFFMPEKDDRYFNFEINPNGCPYVGFGRSRQDRVVLYRRDAKQLFAIRTQKTPDGWEAAFLPASLLAGFLFHRFPSRQCVQVRRKNRPRALSFLESLFLRNPGFSPARGFRRHDICMSASRISC